MGDGGRMGRERGGLLCWSDAVPIDLISARFGRLWLFRCLVFLVLCARQLPRFVGSTSEGATRLAGAADTHDTQYLSATLLSREAVYSVISLRTIREQQDRKLPVRTTAPVELGRNIRPQLYSVPCSLESWFSGGLLRCLVRETAATPDFPDQKPTSRLWYLERGSPEWFGSRGRLCKLGLAASSHRYKST